jgi:hypothetical protein
LIDQNVPDGAETLRELVMQLSHLPLAIVQAAAYINKNGISPAAYIELHDEADATKIELLSENFEDDRVPRR